MHFSHSQERRSDYKTTKLLLNVDSCERAGMSSCIARVNHLIQENVRSRSKYQPCLSCEQVHPALLIALTHEGRDSGLGVGNSCSFQLIFNYPGSHEGGYRRGRRVGVQTMRLATRHAIRAEVKLIKNRKWPAIIVVITQHSWSMLKLLTSDQ